MTSPLLLDPHSHLPAWMRISTLKKATSMWSYFQGVPWFSHGPLLSTWPLWPPKGPSSSRPMPWSSETSLETWSQPGLDGPRGTRKEIEHSYNFQEAVNPKGLRQSSLATPRDRKIEAIYFLQGPLSRLCSWGSPILFFSPSCIQTDSPWFGVLLLLAVPAIFCVIFLILKIAPWGWCFFCGLSSQGSGKWSN